MTRCFDPTWEHVLHGPPAPLQPLEVISLVEAAARYELDPEQLRLVEELLAGKEKRMPDGTVVYLRQDIEAVLRQDLGLP